jgi:hypothetical protein
MSEQEDIIFIPTYPPHFGCVWKLLGQYFTMIAEEERVPVYVVFSYEADRAAFHEKCAEEWRDKYHSVVVDNMLMCGNKFILQCYKKFYALQKLNYRRAMVWDSDTEIIKAFSPKAMIASDKHITTLYKHKNYHPFDAAVIANTRRFFGYTTTEKAMYFEQPWIFVKEWVDEFFGWWLKGRDLLQVMNTVPPKQNVFEILAYYEYLVEFKRGIVNVIDCDEIMEKHGIDVKKGQGFINLNYIYQFHKHYPVQKLAEIVKEQGIVMICGNNGFVEQMMQHNPDICIRLHVDRKM